MAFGTEQAIQLLREILRELSSGSDGSGEATAGNQDAQIVLETAISNALTTLNITELVIRDYSIDSNSRLQLIQILLETIRDQEVNVPKATEAKQDPTAKYNIANTDTASTVQYFGFLDKDGNWYVLKNNGAGIYTYCSGLVASPYATAWTGRAGLTYVTFDNAF